MQPSSPISSRQLHRKLLSALDQHADPHWREDLRRCVPRVIDLIDENHDLPSNRRTAEIRTILREQYMVGADGAAMRHDDERALDRHVDLITREVEKVRNVRIRRGDWSDTPVPPQMFG